MSKLEKLQAADSRTDLALLLGRNISRMTYILYKIDDDEKYNTFEIPKKQGGTRLIKAPIPELKQLQLQLANFLYDCVAEEQFKKEEGTNKKMNFMRVSHGFQRGRNIVTNAAQHQKRRYVFNIDLKEFFDTINFGRVRGFFIKDSRFQLNENVATVIAQIACHNNGLPQGSPCSPIISNLVGNILDKNLSKLARDNKCTYTRYADDLTFSTNLKEFPSKIAENIIDDDLYSSTLQKIKFIYGEVPSGRWVVGDHLRDEIERSGFAIKESKTRMSLRSSRQEVTGLVVNQSPNINQDYYRYAKSMCRNLFSHGNYYLPDMAYTAENNDGIEGGDEAQNDLPTIKKLEGILSHIDHIKREKKRRARLQNKEKSAHFTKEEQKNDFNNPVGYRKLYRKFLQYMYFMVPEEPLIITEGLTDIIYIKCAIDKLYNRFPHLAEVVNDNGNQKIKRKIKFLKRDGKIINSLGVASGASGHAKLIDIYSEIVKCYKHKLLFHPVIIVCDNDKGIEEVYKNATKITGRQINILRDPFYYLGNNLYLVKIPEGINPGCIEGLFSQQTRDVIIDGKSFSANYTDNDYEKYKFAQYIRKNKHSIDFSSFDNLLERIQSCILDYSNKLQNTTN